MRSYSSCSRVLFVLFVVAVAAASVACASTTPGARPHDMSAAQHTAMADNEAKVGELHAGQYDPQASKESQRCSTNPRVELTGACWTSTSNATQAHLEDAKRHQKMAADHRAASQALRTAEAGSCAGLSDENRDMSPFDHREDIASVEPLTAGTPSASGKSQSVMEGATVTFRAVAGMTAPWLQRVVDCHLARNAALGHDVPEMAYCPLVPKGVTARVTGTDTGFAVAIRSDDPQTAQEILRRARVLVIR